MALNAAVNGQQPFRNRLQSLFKRRKRTYIIPSRFGLAFGIMTLVLFFMAVGYANNLIYIFVFFLTSVGFTGMLITNRNVQRVEIITIKGQDLFATEEGSLLLEFHNNDSAPSWDMEARLEKTDVKTKKTPVAAFTSKEVRLDFMSPHRGLQKLPRFILESTFPFGLLRAWKVFKFDAEILIYPSREGTRIFPQDSVGGEDLQKQGLFRDHREFQTADPVSKIDWKASARRQELLVKNYEEPEKPTLHFHWDQTAQLTNYEDRISQLALWVDEAERSGHSYSLLAGKQEVAAGKGLNHWRECLGILALLPEKDLR
ncbi:DUF58 domain-containing protein [Bdellovibrio sp. HCB2-146]|uniref:DUF58 domain-containing protein n=1 Tax=Bdellovibrio sp. HCB2-146 TaxID=3394362 RepID=UPI0039BCC982